jgi:hypothetical protein
MSKAGVWFLVLMGAEATKVVRRTTVRVIERCIVIFVVGQSKIADVL